MRSVAATERLTDAAGLVTLLIGTALAAAPDRTSTAMGLGTSRSGTQALGLADLVLAAGLLRRRPRWPWMVGRTCLNVVVARLFRTEWTRPGGVPRARGGALAMTGLTAVDGCVALVLWRSRR